MQSPAPICTYLHRKAAAKYRSAIRRKLLKTVWTWPRDYLRARFLRIKMHQQYVIDVLNLLRLSKTGGELLSNVSPCTSDVVLVLALVLAGLDADVLEAEVLEVTLEVDSVVSPVVLVSLSVVLAPDVEVFVAFSASVAEASEVVVLVAHTASVHPSDSVNEVHPPVRERDLVPSPQVWEQDPQDSQS
mmetsp:Transcript_67238/g.157734  ORF Transcript_67238/g.157734 Transcript_67238/m.157734 type:complete len:188 (-) Transcript_67238:341-904(-)